VTRPSLTLRFSIPAATCHVRPEYECTRSRFATVRTFSCENAAVPPGLANRHDSTLVGRGNHNAGRTARENAHVVAVSNLNGCNQSCREGVFRFAASRCQLSYLKQPCIWFLTSRFWTMRRTRSTILRSPSFQTTSYSVLAGTNGSIQSAASGLRVSGHGSTVHTRSNCSFSIVPPQSLLATKSTRTFVIFSAGARCFSRSFSARPFDRILLPASLVSWSPAARTYTRLAVSQGAALRVIYTERRRRPTGMAFTRDCAKHGGHLWAQRRSSY
jgi:hypothetical protein